MTDLRSTAEGIHEQFSDQLEITVDDVEERLQTLVEDYRVPAEEARRSVVSSYLDEADMDREELGGDSERVQVAEIEEGDRWVDLRVEVVDLWEPGHESIAQVGLLGDESGTIRFVTFESSDLPALEEGQAYALSNVVTDEYEDRYSVKLNRTTDIEELDEEIEVEYDGDGEAPGGSERVQVAEIEEGDRWVDLRVEVVDLWEPGHESIAQVGLLGDESGTIRFVTFESSDLPDLEEGATYRLANVVTDEYEDRYSVKLNRTTDIEELDEEIEVGDDATEVEGALVDIQSGSGLIKRCPEEDCTRVLQNGRCSEHGEVEGEFDLRIKGVLDDGTDVHEIIFDREATEELTGITLEEAKEMAMDALDTEVVADEMSETVLGRYYRVAGPTFGRYLLADEIERLADPADPESTLIRARSI